MTRPLPQPDPQPDPRALDAAAAWHSALADVLAEVGRRVGRLSEQIAHDWPDDLGREWAERSARLCRELGRDALAAGELGEALRRRAADPGPEPGDAVPPVRVPVASPRPGIRLGGTDAHRVDDERGMRIAELPPPG